MSYIILELAVIYELKLGFYMVHFNDDTSKSKTINLGLKNQNKVFNSRAPIELKLKFNSNT